MVCGTCVLPPDYRRQGKTGIGKRAEKRASGWAAEVCRMGRRGAAGVSGAAEWRPMSIVGEGCVACCCGPDDRLGGEEMA